MESETYYIPANYTDAGKLFGLFEIRNAIEAVLVGLPVLAFCAHLEDHRVPVSAGAGGGLRPHRIKGRQPDPLSADLVDLAAKAPGHDLARRGK